MTKNRRATSKAHSDLALNQYRLRVIAMFLEDNIPLPQSESQFLITSLRLIGEGHDANDVLKVKLKPGERKYMNELHPLERRQLAMSWIVAAMRPESEGGLGLSLEDALEQAAVHHSKEANFGFTAETLLHYWNNFPEQRTASFSPPLSSEPIRREKGPRQKEN